MLVMGDGESVVPAERVDLVAYATKLSMRSLGRRVLAAEAPSQAGKLVVGSCRTPTIDHRRWRCRDRQGEPTCDSTCTCPPIGITTAPIR